MKIRAEENDLIVEQVYSGLTLRTSEGNEIAICMRDDTFEFNVMPNGISTENWYRVNMQSGEVESMRAHTCKDS